MNNRITGKEIIISNKKVNSLEIYIKSNLKKKVGTNNNKEDIINIIIGTGKINPKKASTRNFRNCQRRRRKNKSQRDKSKESKRSEGRKKRKFIKDIKGIKKQITIIEYKTEENIIKIKIMIMISNFIEIMTKNT